MLKDYQIALLQNKDLKEKNISRNYEELSKELENMKLQLEKITNNNRKSHENLKMLKEHSEKLQIDKENKN